MYKSFLFNFAGIFIVALIDACVVSSLPFGLYRIHFLFLAIIFLLLISNIRLAAWWALGGALILEAFSFRFFGTYLLAGFVVLALAHFLFAKVMTNRSVYSVMMISAVVTAVADLMFLLFDYWSTQNLGSLLDLSKAFVFSLIVNVGAAIIIFYISSSLTKRLKPVFIPFIKS